MSGKGKRKNIIEYIDEIEKHKIIPLEMYVISKVPIFHKCLICENVWKTRPNNIVQGQKCPKCSRRISVEDFKIRLKKNNVILKNSINFVELSNVYEFTCLKCKSDWKEVASKCLKRNSCPKCKIRANTKTNEMYLSELNITNSKLMPIEKYQTAVKKIKHKCLNCGFIWKISPNNALSGRGCPKCSTGGIFNKKTKILLYYIHFPQYNVYKIGITSKTVKDRFMLDYNAGIKIDIIKQIYFSTPFLARNVEKSILENLVKNKYKGKKFLRSGGETECFYDNIFSKTK